MTTSASTMPTPLKALLVAALLLFLGSVTLKRIGADGRADPIAAVDNGGPRGLLLLWLAVERAGQGPVRIESDRALAAATAEPASIAVVVPPPEQSTFSAPEAEALLDLAARGAIVVVLCDPEEGRQKRLRRVVSPLGVSCLRAPEGTGPERQTLAAPRGRTLFVRDRGRVGLSEEAALGVPLTSADERGALGAVAIARGAGHVIVIGSTSVASNDGLTEADNAAFLDSALAGRRVIFDERHHLTRGAAAVQKAVLQGTGPATALVCALLLVPLTLLSLAPRRGELVRADEDIVVPAGQARVIGLAALLAPRASTSPLPARSSPHDKHS